MEPTPLSRPPQDLAHEQNVREELIQIGCRELGRALAVGDVVAAGEGLRTLLDAYRATSGSAMGVGQDGSAAADSRAYQTRPAKAGRSGSNLAQGNEPETQTHAAKAARSASLGVVIGKALIDVARAEVAAKGLEQDPTITGEGCVRAWQSATGELRSPSSAGKRIKALYKAGFLPNGIEPARTSRSLRGWRIPLSVIRTGG